MSNEHLIFREAAGDRCLHVIDFSTRKRYLLDNIPATQGGDTGFEVKEFYQIVDDFLFVSDGFVITAYDLEGIFEKTTQSGRLEMSDGRSYRGPENSEEVDMKKARRFSFDISKETKAYRNVIWFGL